MAVTLGSIVFDCADIETTSAFYAALTGWPVVKNDGDWIDLKAAEGITVSFQLAPDHAPPQWPSAGHPQQMHLDLDVPADDMNAEHARALELGAIVLDDSPEHPTFRVFADPAGHPFCLCAC
jgi:catechol 2,3-dioxygenase-like lactoylglutathione lyase family enzyme